jgi:RNA polymerase subunit RPABC4/transcription elongation factor Spt4
MTYAAVTRFDRFTEIGATMLIFYGRYRFWKKRVGVRNDYCNACDQEHLTEQWRSVDFGHIYWIPLIPLGVYRHWHCANCGLDPRARYKTSFKSLKIIGLVSVAIVFLATLMMPTQPGELLIAWGFRSVLILTFLGLLYWTFKGSTDDDLRNQKKREMVVPLSTDVCVYCDGDLTNDEYPYCPFCEVQIY